VQAPWIEADPAWEETASEIEAFLPLPAAGAAARSAVPRAVRVGVPLEPAAAGDLPVLEEAAAAMEVEADPAADGGK